MTFKDWFIVIVLIVAAFFIGKYFANPISPVTYNIYGDTSKVQYIIKEGDHSEKPPTIIISNPNAPVAQSITYDSIQKIINNAFATAYYKDVRRDSNIEATIEDSIRNNRIWSRNFSYRYLKPVAVQPVVYDRSRELRAGFQAYRINGISEIAPKIEYRTVSGVEYGLTKSITSDGVGLEVTFPLFKSKK